MSEAPQISTVDEVCTFISGWFDLKNDPAGSQIALPFAVPQAIETVHRRLGRLWLEHANMGIFDSQDTLISPHRYQARPDGIVPFIWENQGVWGCGFKPEMSAKLWVTGDWPDHRSDTKLWRTTQDVVDNVVIFVMLSNMVWTSADCAMDDKDDKPAEADRLLWNFAPWAGFSGFWTNNETNLIRMQGSGWGVTARR